MVAKHRKGCHGLHCRQSCPCWSQLSLAVLTSFLPETTLGTGHYPVCQVSTPVGEDVDLAALPLHGQVMGELALEALCALAMPEVLTQHRLWVGACRSRAV